MTEVQLTLNGSPVSVASPGDTLLIDVLREELHLHGTRLGCGLEQCGACRVQVDGVPACSCTLRLADVAGREVRTVEAFGDGHPLVEAFVALNAGQCGYCLSGILITADQLLSQNPGATREAVKAALVPHLCRCGAHNRIINAVLAAGRHYPLETGA